MSNIRKTIAGLICVILLICSFIAFTEFTTMGNLSSICFRYAESVADLQCI